MNFKAEKLELWEVKIPFRFSFKHALAERKEANNLILAIYDADGNVGYGEVLPRPYLTGETVSSAWQDIVEHWWPQLRKIEFTDAENPRQKLQSLYEQADSERKTGSYAGLDIAIYDLWGRRTKTPGRRLLGQKSKRHPLTWPIGGGGKRAVFWMSWIGKVLGFKEYKLKVGRSDDKERLAIVRDVLGYNVDLRVDANAAWSIDDAIKWAKLMQDFQVSSLEQPIPAGDFAGLKRVQDEGGIPVMADESLCTLNDAKKLAELQAADIWNLRLAKVGGFTGMLNLLELARANNIKVHLGVLVGESPMITAACRACLGLYPFSHVEYGFPWLLLSRNIFRGGPGGNFGVGRPLRSRAGIGVTPRRKLMGELSVRHQVFLQ